MSNRLTSSETTFSMYERSCPVCQGTDEQELYTNADYHYLDARGVNFGAPLRYVMCTSCAHIYKNPNIDPVEMRELYRNHIIEIPSDQSSDRINHHFTSFQKLMSDKMAEFPHQRSILEIGCGNGRLLDKLHSEYQDKILSIKGIEPSLGLFEYLEKQGNFVYENVFFDELGDMAQYDLIIMDNVFEHFDYPDRELKRINKLLAEDGILYLSIPNIRVLPAGFVDMFSGHPSNYLLENLSLLLVREGFYIEKHDYHLSWLNCIVRRKGSEDMIADINFSHVRHLLMSHIGTHLEQNKQLLQSIKSRIEKEVQSAAREGKKMFLFGAGDHTQELLSHINFQNVVAGLLDSNPMYHGKARLGYQVYAPQEVQNYEFEKVIISSQSFQKEMIQTLIDCNIASEQIISLYD